MFSCFLFVCFYVCLFVCLSFCLFVCSSVCLNVCLSMIELNKWTVFLSSIFKHCYVCISLIVCLSVFNFQAPLCLYIFFNCLRIAFCNRRLFLDYSVCSLISKNVKLSERMLTKTIQLFFNVNC